MSLPQLSYSQGRSNIREVKIWELIQRKDLKLQEIDVIAKRYFDAVGRERGTGFKQYERWKYEQQFHLDENGYILPEGYDQNAYLIAASAETTSTTATGWTEIGPSYWNRTSSWNPGVGRITSIAVAPSNPNVIYICSPGGGLWKSSQGGNQWVPLTDYDNSMMNMFAVAVHPTNANLVYAGKTNGQIMKSFNGGLNWTAANSGVGQIMKIVFHPADPNIMYAVGNSGISKSLDGGNTFVVKYNSSSVEDIEFLPANSDVLIATGSRVIRSSNGGENWAILGSSQGINFTDRSLVAVSPQSPQRVYVVQASGSVFGRLLRSDDGGNNFYATVEGNPSNGTNYFGYNTDGRGTTGQAWYDMAMTVNPNNADEVHIAGIICWKSSNGGYSFVATTAWSLPNSIGYNHADVHVLEWLGSTIYSGSDGGIYKSTDFGDNWIDLTSGLGIRQFYKIATSKTNPSLVMGGAQDNGTSIFKSNTWIDWLGADGMDCIISPLDANLIIGTSQYGNIYRTTNGGSSYSNLSRPASGNWVTPLFIEANSNVMYGGWNGVYRSTDLGSSWTRISSTFITSNLNTLAVSASNPNHIYSSAGTIMHLTKDGGSNWSSINVGSTISSIGIHPKEPEKIWITTTNSSQRLLYSENAGTNILNISSGLPAMAARSVAVEDSSDDGVYVAMNIGVYYKNKQMASWVNLTENLPLVAINEVELLPNGQKIKIGTYGRGIWERSKYSFCFSTANLSASQINGSEVNLRWDAVTGVSGYKLEYRLNSTDTWTTAVSSTTSTTFSLTGLLSNSLYIWRVTTICESGTGQTVESQFTTGNLCTAPSSLVSSEITKNSAKLSWKSVNEALSYSLDYRIVGSNTWINLSSNLNTTEYQLNGLTEASSYEWRVGTNCSSDSSSYVEATFQTAITCLAPSSLSATILSSTSVSLQWQAVVGAQSYNLEFKNKNSTSWISIVSNHPDNFYNLSGLSEGNAYDWRVASNCGTLSGLSSSTEASFTLPETICADIYESNDTRQTAKLISTSAISARIGDVNDQDWFEFKIGNGKNTNVKVTISNLPSNTHLYLYNASGNLLTSSTLSNVEGQSVIFNSSLSRTSYFIQVKGDGLSFSNKCYTLLAETNTKPYDDPLRCNSPTGLGSSSIDLNSAVVSWSPEASGLSYQVEYKLATAANWTIAVTETPGTSISLTGLQEGQKYDWRIRTNCLASVSTYSQSSFTTASNSCVDVYENNNLQKDAKSIPVGSTINATISNSSDEDWFVFNTGKSKSTNIRITLDGLPANYDLYLYNSSGQLLASSKNLGTNPDQIIINKASTNTQYFVRIISATGENSNSCYSLLVENSTKAFASSLRELADEITEEKEILTVDLPKVENEAVRIYPNPSFEEIFLEFYSPLAHSALLELYDFNGRLIKSKKYDVIVGKNIAALDVQDVITGTYLLKLSSNRTLLTRKIIIR